MIERKNTRVVEIKGLLIGGDNPVSVQSMTNVPLNQVNKTIKQIEALSEAGAKLVRLAVLTVEDADYLKEIIPRSSVPLCADIHFDHRIALKAIDLGISKIRINPGNIGSLEKIKEVVKAANSSKVPIRIGVNGGSIDTKKYSSVTPESLVDSAMGHVNILEGLDFGNIVVSIKASDVITTILANELFSRTRNYPVHVGLTEAGYGMSSVVQSSICIGNLLMKGIGDTVRVSMTGDPVEEVKAGYEILKSLNFISTGIKIISCPTCGRTDPDIDLLEIAKMIDEHLTNRYNSELSKQNKLLKVAVMGCEVNGPGEACHADVGIAGARSGNFILFSGGKQIKKISHEEIIDNLCKQIDVLLKK